MKTSQEFKLRCLKEKKESINEKNRASERRPRGGTERNMGLQEFESFIFSTKKIEKFLKNFFCSNHSPSNNREVFSRASEKKCPNS